MPSLPKFFRKSPDYGVTFDWSDTIQNLGYKRYYLSLGYSGSAALTYIINPNMMEGTPPAINSGAITEDNAWHLMTTKTWDLSILKQCTIGGKLYINYTIEVSGATDTYAYMVVTARRTNNFGVITDVGATTTPEYGDGTNLYFSGTIAIDVTSRTYGYGYTFSIRFQMYGKTSYSGSGSRTWSLYCDPSNGLTFTDGYGRTIGTDLIVDVPFKVIE